jgi:hypothetical protein
MARWRLDDRGASALEYVIVLGLIALLASAAFAIFGGKVRGLSDQEAECVETFECSGGYSGADYARAGSMSGESPDGNATKSEGATGALGIAKGFFEEARDTVLSTAMMLNPVMAVPYAIQTTKGLIFAAQNSGLVIDGIKREWASRTDEENIGHAIFLVVSNVGPGGPSKEIPKVLQLATRAAEIEALRAAKVAELEAARGAKLAEEAAARATQQADRFNATGGRYQTTALHPEYVGENQAGNSVWGSQVRYLTTAAERAPYKLEVRQVTVNGKTEARLFGADGRPFDTADAVNFEGKSSAIFVMNSKGEIFASKQQAIGQFHHSSLAGGEDVAAAGEISVSNGIIVDISNASGHYRPSNFQTMQAVDSLQKQGYGGTMRVTDVTVPRRR